ncbi:MAG TPA: ion channel [Nitrososphaerales archaeon]|nr:ion channel [Nitrososphaerales archaeon]
MRTNTTSPVRLRRFRRRAFYSIILIVVVLAVGTLGMHFIEGWAYIDSFYFTSMLVTAEGPPNAPATDAGKIFASFMAFVGVGSVVTALVFILGPALAKIWRKGIGEVEKEIRVAEHKIERKKNEDEP